MQQYMRGEKSYVIIVCRRFADGRLRFWKAGCLGNDETIGGVAFALCERECGSDGTGRGERDEEEEGWVGVYDEGGPFRPRVDGSSLGVRLCMMCGEARPAPSERRLFESEELPLVGDELCERCSDPDLRGPYCCSTNGGVGGNRGMST